MQTLTFGFYIWYLLLINICCVSLFCFCKRPWRMFCIIAFQEMKEITKNLIRIFGWCLMKIFVFNEAAGFQASMLLKLELLRVYFTGFCLLLRRTHFRYRTVMATFTVYLFKLQPLRPLICSLCHWFHLNGILVTKKHSSETLFKWFKTAGMTSEKLCVLINKWFFWLMGLEGPKVQYVALFYDLRIAEIEFIYKKPCLLRHKNEAATGGVL